MLDKISNFWNRRRVKEFRDVRNLGLYVFALIVLAISWSSVKAIEANYKFQKKIAFLKQQNIVLQLENENIGLSNRFYQTDQYLDMAARQNLGLGAPGEKELLVPDNVALQHVDQKLIQQTVKPQPADQPSRIAKNLQDWRDFLLGRKLFSD